MKKRSAIIVPLFMGFVCMSLTIGMVAYQNTISKKETHLLESLTRFTLLVQQASAFDENNVSGHNKETILAALDSAGEISLSFPPNDVRILNHTIIAMKKNVLDFYAAADGQYWFDSQVDLKEEEQITSDQKKYVKDFREQAGAVHSFAYHQLDELREASASNADAKFWFRLVWLIAISGLTTGITFYVSKMSKGYNGILYEMEQRVKQETRRIHTVTDFINNITHQQFTEDAILDASDSLSKPLLEMRDRLAEVGERDRQINRVTQGLAQLANLLQNNSVSVNERYTRATRFIVQYLKANQGCFFLLKGEDENRYLDMVSTYAYDRQKFVEKKILSGEGLSGQAVLEGQTIYLTQVPPDYVRITSGLGEALPRVVVIVPLRLNNQVYGVIELASFNQFQAFERELLEKMGESLASFIATQYSSEQTRQLLEQSERQAERLRAKEEEMRLKVEELTAKYENLAERSRSLQVIEPYDVERRNPPEEMDTMPEGDAGALKISQVTRRAMIL